MSYKIEYYCVSNIGKCRSNNQDNFFCIDTYKELNTPENSEPIYGKRKTKDTVLVGIFDGMGGEECGEVASYIAAHTLSDYSFGKEPGKELVQYCRIANENICNYAEENQISSMGTTAAILYFNRKKIHLCNIGDSRIYLFTNQKLKQISYDHVATAMSGRKPPLLQNLGIPESEMIIQPFIATGEYNNNDIYLICSDGVTDMLTNDEIEAMLQENTNVNVAEEILKKALERGGKDNITIIMCQVKHYNILFNNKGEKT